MGKNCFAVFLLAISLTRASDLAPQEVIAANNLFTGSIYKELLKENQENFMVSPFSIETLLSFAQSGAKDETGKEIRSALRLPDDQEKIKAAFKSLTSSLKSTEHYSLNTANKMYLQQKFEIHEDFKKTASEIFDSGSENVDFSKAEEAASAINKWVEEQTKEKIKDLVDPLSIHPLTVAILVNALHFKGNFSKQFKAAYTKKADFHSGSVYQVETMYSTREYGYDEDTELNAKMLRLGFKGGDASLVIVLPNEKNGLSALENNLEKVFTRDNFTYHGVRVQLPKFKIESKFLLKTFLENLGVKLAFTEAADFSGIAGGKGDIYINTVIQKTFVEVNEDGVEAAAATYSDFLTKSGAMFIHTKEFIADHPFIFYIKIKDIIMFAGRFVKP